MIYAAAGLKTENYGYRVSHTEPSKRHDVILSNRDRGMVPPHNA